MAFTTSIVVLLYAFYGYTGRSRAIGAATVDCKQIGALLGAAHAIYIPITSESTARAG